MSIVVTHRSSILHAQETTTHMDIIIHTGAEAGDPNVEEVGV